MPFRRPVSEREELIRTLHNVVEQSQQAAIEIATLRAQMAGTVEVNDSKFVTHRTLLDSQAEKVKLALDSADKAVTKSEDSINERLAGINHVRETMREQSLTFMPRTESTTRWESMGARVDALAVTIGARIDLIATDLDKLESRVTTAEARAGGLNAGWAYLIGFASLGGALLAIARSFS